MKAVILLCSLAVLVVFTPHVTQANFLDGLVNALRTGHNFVNRYGLADSGFIPMDEAGRCGISYSVKFVVFRYRCTCVNSCNGQSNVKVKGSRTGSMEHCIRGII